MDNLGPADIEVMSRELCKIHGDDPEKLLYSLKNDAHDTPAWMARRLFIKEALEAMKNANYQVVKADKPGEAT